MLYPLFLKLRGRSVLVVGAGSVAVAKLRGLLGSGAQVTVVATRASEAVQAMAARGALVLYERPFEEQDVAGRLLVVAATNDSEANARIRRCCQARGVLINAVDDPDNCDFFVPAVVDRGAVQVAISTQGASPALVRVLREEIERVLHPTIGRYAELVASARARIRAMVPEFEARRAANEAVVRSRARTLLEQGDEASALAEIEAVLEQLRNTEVKP